MWSLLMHIINSTFERFLFYLKLYFEYVVAACKMFNNDWFIKYDSFLKLRDVDFAKEKNGRVKNSVSEKSIIDKKLKLKIYLKINTTHKVPTTYNYQSILTWIRKLYSQLGSWKVIEWLVIQLSFHSWHFCSLSAWPLLYDM